MPVCLSYSHRIKIILNKESIYHLSIMSMYKFIENITISAFDLFLFSSYVCPIGTLRRSASEHETIGGN